MSEMLYLECSLGISGDMMVGALLDLGADQEALKKAVESLHVKGAGIRVSRVKKAGLDACDFAVVLDEVHENHDHDMEYLHGKGKKQFCEGKQHDHGHRGLADILELIQKGDMSERAKELASEIFCILASAEAKAHGIPQEQVHFHEVGAVDSIVDIVAAAVCLDNLGITKVVVPCLNEGKGSVRCQHGILPVPVPAVANIAAAHQIPLHIMDLEGEFVTPTGAAIVAAVRTENRLPEQFLVKKIGLGAGKRTYERPSLLRIMLIEKVSECL